MLDSIRDLTPIILVILFFQLFVIKQPLPNLGDLLLGVVFVVMGLTFFIHGLEQGLFPIGESMAHAFAEKGVLSGYSFLPSLWALEPRLLNLHWLQ